MLPQNLENTAIAVALCAAVGFGAYYSIASKDGSLQMLCEARTNGEATKWDAIDNLVTTATGVENSVLLCHDIGSAPWLESVLASIYFRGSYTVLPRRIYAAPADTVINEAKDFAGLGWEPNAGFVDSHRVGAAIIISQDSSGNPSVGISAAARPTKATQP